MMPELPDVEVFKQYVNATSLHQKIQTVPINETRVLIDISQQTLQRRLKGRKLQATARHGKHLFMQTGPNSWLRLHFGMTGFVRYYKRSSRQPKHVCLRLDFSNGYHLAYDSQRLLGQIGWTSDPDAFVQDHKLGPDALKDLGWQAFKQLLSGKRGSIKSALMNQNTIAGVGNIYSDEILFQARIDPRTQVRNLENGRLKALYETMHQVLRDAIEYRADPQKFPGHFLTPCRDEGKRCPRCSGSLKKITISGRSSYICPDCQKSDV
jgi:formamidopyrimidine-DNA glycosylase